MTTSHVGVYATRAMAEPLAYFLTWTCYGTWLHGDDRGSVDRHQNSPNEDLISPTRAWSEWSARELKGEIVTLSEQARLVVEQTIEDHCAYRKWTLHVKNVRSNHVHVIVTSDRTPRRTMDELKGWSTRRLRTAGLFGQDAEVWTEGGSKKQLWNERALEAAIRYVWDGQGPDIT
jgi:REP element-mobilizing transposase RayT